MVLVYVEDEKTGVLSLMSVTSMVTNVVLLVAGEPLSMAVTERT